MLLLWSGGCDSTQMLWWYARQAVANSHEPPRTLAITYDEQIPCANQQRKARQRLLAEFKRRKLPVDHAELTAECKSTASIALERGNKDGNDSGLVQPFLWLSFAQLFLRHDEDLYLGYIRGDDIWHYRAELFQAFQSTQAVLKKTGALKVPYEWWSKQDIIAELRKEGLLKLCWYCETRQAKKPCGECPACRTMSAGLHLEGGLEKNRKWWDRNGNAEPKPKNKKRKRRAIRAT